MREDEESAMLRGPGKGSLVAWEGRHVLEVEKGLTGWSTVVRGGSMGGEGGDSYRR